jgi:acyl carrier protein
MKKEVIKIIANIMEIPEKKIKMENTLIGDLDLESLDIVTLIAELEEKYQIEILDKEIKKMQTVEDVVNYLEAHV